MTRYILLITLLLFHLQAFEDDDIDGVSNKNDLCPDTSFEDTVDEDGCSENQNSYRGKITLMVGSDINIDDETTTDYNFLLNYTYNEWGLSLYNSQQTTKDVNTNANKSSTGDLYLSGSYDISKASWLTTFTLGSKLATGDSELSTGENDYFTALSLSYMFNERTALTTQISYTLTGDSSDTDYRNSLGLSLGIGYAVNEKWYSSLSYQNANSIYEGSDDYRSILLLNSYRFSDRYFATLNYTKGLDEISYDNTISLKLGVNFE